MAETVKVALLVSFIASVAWIERSEIRVYPDLDFVPQSRLLAKQALESGRGVAELVLEEKLLSPEQLEDILLPEHMTRPRRVAKKPSKKSSAKK